MIFLLSVKRFVFILSLCITLMSKLWAQDADGIWYLGFNLNSTAMKHPSSKLLRKAIVKSISRVELNQALWGENEESTHMFPIGVGLQYSLQTKYNPSEAREIVGSLPDELKNFEFRVLMTDGFQTLVAWEQIKSQLKPLGLRFLVKKIQSFPEKQVQEAYEKGDYEMFLSGFKAENSTTVQALLCPILSSSGKWNFSHYQLDPLDALCTNNDKPESGIFEKIEEDLPLWPLYDIYKLL